MPVINQIQCKLIALSNLNEEESARAKGEWDRRFRRQDAFWIDIKPGQTDQNLARELARQFTEQNITQLNNATLVTALFLDLEKELQEEEVKAMAAVPGNLRAVFGCNVPLTMEFGWLGEIAFGDKPLLRKNAQRVIDINCNQQNSRKQLCLVGKSPIVRKDREHNWKAVMFLLDVLRRLNAPASAIPVAGSANPNDDIGFLRYSEYDETLLGELNAKMDAVQRRLGNSGMQEFAALLERERNRLRDEIDNAFPINRLMIPQHPGMKVTGMLATLKATKGKNREYEQARHSTQGALEQTARQLEQDILETGCPQDPDGILRRLLDEAGVGLELESNTERMKNLLLPEVNGIIRPQLPQLAYSPAGPAEEMENYLIKTRDMAANKAVAAFGNKLNEAYLSRDPAEYERRKAQLQEERMDLQTALGGLVDKANLTELLRNSAPLPESCFNPIIPAGTSARFAACRRSEEYQELERACVGGLTAVYQIDERFGGLKTIDGAPIKAVQLLLFDCNESSLNDLIQ